MKALFLLVLFTISCQVALAQEPQTTPSAPRIEEVFLAKDNGMGKAGEQVAEFGINDIPIHCVVLLESPTKMVVRMNFVAVNVAGVKPDTKVVSASYTTSEGQNRVNFTGRPDGIWTAGKYRVDLFLDGKLVKNIEFDIKGGGSVTGASYLQSHPADKPRPKSPRRP